MKIKRVKVIYGDGTAERFYSTSYAQAQRYAHTEAKRRNTIVRGFSYMDRKAGA